MEPNDISMKFTLHRRTRKLAFDSRGRRTWKPSEVVSEVSAKSLAVIVCDMWDRHWCRSASERVQDMAPRMNDILKTARTRGVLIVHAPSETMEYYEGTPARLRAVQTPPIAPPSELPHDDPALPIDDTDGGCDSGDNLGEVNERVWTRQHPAIFIDQNRDVISDEGVQIYSILKERGINQVVIMGVHTNMCVLNRSFGIKQLTRRGVDVTLCRDLTDSMYNPGRPPYVDHKTGTDLVVDYIESHWCPTIHSGDLVESHLISS